MDLISFWELLDKIVKRKMELEKEIEFFEHQIQNFNPEEKIEKLREEMNEIQKEIVIARKNKNPDDEEDEELNLLNKKLQLKDKFNEIKTKFDRFNIKLSFAKKELEEILKGNKLIIM